MKRLASRPWLLPVLAAVVFHLPALFCDFVYDDVPLIAEHPHLSDPSFIARIWTRDYGLEFTREPKGLYRPAFMALVFLVRQLAGASPLTFHLTSLALFCVAAALVTRLAAAVDLRRSRAFPIVAGTLYAVHPARVETVSLVMSLPDLLVEICALGLACALLRTTLRTTPAVGWRAPAVCGALSLLAALSKESAFFIIPALSVTALLLGCLRRAPKSCDCGRSAFPDAARPDDRPGLFPPSTIVASAAVSKQRAISAIASLSALSAGFMLRSLVGVHAPFPFAAGIQRLFGESSGASLRTLGFALKDVLMPGPTVFWRQTALTGNSAFAPVIALVIAAFAAWWALAFLRRSLPMALLAAWIGAGGVNLMLLAAAGYPYSERYLAIAPAAIALCAAGRAVFGFVAGRRLVSAAAGGTRRMAGWLVAAYLAGCGGYTLAGSAACLTPLSFFAAMQKANPSDVIPVGAMAETLNRIGTAEDVELCVRRATSLDHTHPQVPRLHNMLIKRYLGDKRYADALRCANWSLGIYPDDPDRMALKAAALACLGRTDAALSSIDRALELRPADPAYRQLRDQIRANAPPLDSAPRHVSNFQLQSADSPGTMRLLRQMRRRPAYACPAKKKRP